MPELGPGWMGGCVSEVSLRTRVGWVGLREGKAGDQDEEGTARPPGSCRS